MRRLALLVTSSLIVGLVALTGCAGSTGTTAPGDGPAEDSPTVVEGEPAEGEPPEGPAEEADAEPAEVKFGQKFTYPDGLAVEITRVRHGKISKSDYKEYYAEEAAPDFVVVTMRITNGTPKRVEISDFTDITFGPDGTGVSPYVEKGSLDGLLLAGRAKSATVKLYIPPQYQDEVVWVQGVDMERDQVVFTGSLADDLN